MGKQPDGTGLVRVPSVRDRGGRGRRQAHRPLGHMALEHLGPPDGVLAQAIGEAVDQGDDALLGHGRTGVVQPVLGGGHQLRREQPRQHLGVATGDR